MADSYVRYPAASGGGGATIGQPVSGGHANDVLYVDASGNLAQSDAFSFVAGLLTITELFVSNPASAAARIRLKNAGTAVGAALTLSTAGNLTTSLGDDGDFLWAGGMAGTTALMALSHNGSLGISSVGAIAGGGNNIEFNYGGTGGNKSLTRVVGDFGAELDNSYDWGISNNFGGDNLRPRYLAVGTAIGVGVTFNSLPDASANLDLRSTSKGAILNPMTTAQRLAIASPATGLIVTDTDLPALCIYLGGWKVITAV